MKKRQTIYLISLSVLSLILFSCAASTGSRYSKNENKKTVDSSTVLVPYQTSLQLVEDFDISPYKIKIEVPENEHINTANNNNNIWFDYGSANSDNKQKVLAGTESGYRVLVSSIDNLEDANNTKLELSEAVNGNEIYIDFEPPFYKLKVGDFTNQKSADNLRFKLNQLGFKEAKVVQETINIFK